MAEIIFVICILKHAQMEIQDLLGSKAFHRLQDSITPICTNECPKIYLVQGSCGPLV
jgi:hypothetical protein